MSREERGGSGIKFQVFQYKSGLPAAATAMRDKILGRRLLHNVGNVDDVDDGDDMEGAVSALPPCAPVFFVLDICFFLFVVCDL